MHSFFPIQKPGSEQVGAILIFVSEFICYCNLPDTFIDSDIFHTLFLSLCSIVDKATIQEQLLSQNFGRVDQI